mmetsp:Transcript_81718/g.206331  ORF Transcript_81718/g.206331 Transcript_81718/m.206331 type:complete len:365 (-) Transcript_81718:85-1179(-)
MLLQQHLSDSLVHLLCLVLIFLKGQLSDYDLPCGHIRRAERQLVSREREQCRNAIVKCDLTRLVLLLWCRASDDLGQPLECLWCGLSKFGQGSRQADGICCGNPHITILVHQALEDRRHESWPRLLGMLLQMLDNVATQKQGQSPILLDRQPLLQTVGTLWQALHELLRGDFHDGTYGVLKASAASLFVPLGVLLVLILLQLGWCSSRISLSLLLRLAGAQKGIVDELEHLLHQLRGLLGIEASRAHALQALGNAIGRIPQAVRVRVLLHRRADPLQKGAQQLTRECGRLAALLSSSARTLDQGSPSLEGRAAGLIAEQAHVIARGEQRQEGLGCLGNVIEECGLHHGAIRRQRLHCLLELLEL